MFAVLVMIVQISCSTELLSADPSEMLKHVGVCVGVSVTDVQRVVIVFTLNMNSRLQQADLPSSTSSRTLLTSSSAAVVTTAATRGRLPARVNMCCNHSRAGW